MTAVVMVPDTEGAMRTWLRTVPEIMAMVDKRVFFGIPKTVVFPCITIHEVGPGAVDPGDAPLAWEMLQFDCWANGQDKRSARKLRDVVVSVLSQLQSGTMLDTETKAIGARIFNAIYSPDPESAQARYIVMAYVMASKVA